MSRFKEAYRAKSNENWDAGELCLERSHVNAAGNRLYYSLYHAAVFWADRLGFCDGRKPPKHPGVEGILRNKYTDDPTAFQTFVDLMNLRVKADYKPSLLEKEDFTDDALLAKVKDLRESLLKT